MMQPTAEAALEILPISETTFIRRDANTKFEFVTNASGVVESIRLMAGPNNAAAKRIAAETLVPFELLLAGKITEGIDGYRVIKKDQPNNVSVSEARLNTLGYNLLRQKKVAESIAIFKLNAEFYPASFNVYDSLGEAYLANGDKALAITNYKKSLELNPDNTGAREALKKLEK
jgi:tetratricopeptide (TPR) repeat protein